MRPSWWRAGTVGLFLASGACTHRQPSVPALIPAVADRPRSWACTASLPTQAAPSTIYREVRAALRRLDLHPVRLDSTLARFTVAGPTAPHGRGSPAQQASFLYLDWMVKPAEDSSRGPNIVVIAPGISSAGAELTPAEERGLNTEADSLAQRVLRLVPSVRQWLKDRPKLCGS